MRMRILWTVVALSCLLAGGRVVRAEQPRIVAAGIPGSLVLCGQGEVSGAAVQQFHRLAGEKEARVVIVQLGNEPPGEGGGLVDRLVARWRQGDTASLTLVRVVTSEQAEDAEGLAPLNAASGVWLTAPAGKSPVALLRGTALEKACRTLLERGGCIAASAGVATLVAERVDDNGQADEGLAQGLAWLPQGVVETRAADEEGAGSGLVEVLEQNRRLVGYAVDPETALVLRGRRIRAAGEGAVRVHLAASPTRPAKEVVLEGPRDFADLTALRRSALARLGPEFPTKEPGKPEVPSGTLIIVGGGGMPEGLMQRFVELAGGAEAKIVVSPISMPDPLPERDRAATQLRELGAAKVTVLRGRTREEVESPEFLAALKEATGVWFGGGRQWRFIDAYENTQVADLMHDVLRRGGVIGGSSAGASIQGDYLVRGDPLGSRPIMAEGYERGMRFLPGVAIDQHFSQRKRQPDMQSLMKTYPQFLGIGIDEATAIVVRGGVAEVVGRNRVLFYDTRKEVKDGEPDHEVVRDGGRYDLVQRKVLD